MTAYTDFHYSPTGSGVISGAQVLEQTEQGINGLGQYVQDNVSGAIDTANQALTIAQTADSNATLALNTANSFASAISAANNTANNALTTAQSAQNTANTASSLATTANNNAATALNAANTATSNVATLTSSVNALGNRMTTAENAISTNAGNITTLQTNLQTTNNNVTAAANAASAAQATATSAQSTATLARNQAYVLRYTGTTITGGGTIAYADIDNTDNIKAGDKIIDATGAIYDIASVDTANQTVTVGASPVINLFCDAENLIPAATDTYDLGSSSYQWNNLYAKNYYYNGTQWGLDQANEWTQGQTIRHNAPSFILKSNLMEKGAVPSARLSSQIFFRDKNDNETARILSRFNVDGTRTLWIALNDFYSNGALDPTGSNIWNSLVLSLAPDGTKSVTVNGDFYPESNADYNLGTSTNKWKSIYSDSYYYGTTAWGLDKANVWTGENSFTYSQLTLKNSNITRGTIPNVNRNYVLSFTDSNNDNVGMIFQQVRSGSGSYKMTFSMNNGTTDHRINFFGFTDGSSSFIPEVTNTTDLGTSTNKWKTLNGINPGALSLPDFSNADPIDTRNWVTSTPTNNAYTPSENGWLNVVVADSTPPTNEFSIYVKSTNFFASAVHKLGDIDDDKGKVGLFIPVIAGITYYVVVKGNVPNVTISATLYSCFGSV